MDAVYPYPMEATMQERFEGSLLGVALGDALGAPHEGGILEGALWGGLGMGKGALLRWTDDTQMTVALAESLVDRGGVDPDHLAMHWARSMEWSRGYGPGASKLLRRIRGGEDWREANRSIFPGGSFGNGGAMRAAPLGLWFHGDPGGMERGVRESTSITHAHPLGIEGAMIIAHAVSWALDGGEMVGLYDVIEDACHHEEYLARIRLARKWLEDPPEVADVRRRLGCSVVAHESVVTAVHAFSRLSGDFKEMMEFIVRLGGDTDTLGAMAGGIFGAYRGKDALPADLLDRLERRPHIEGLAREISTRRPAPE
jgi:poly(ADP-ribose) glycohydrolase ARH3